MEAEGTTIFPDKINVLCATDSDVESLKSFTAFVKSMVLGKHYYMPETFKYKWAEVEYNKEHGYSWCLERNYDVIGSVGYVHPTKGQYVQYWKTEQGAKQNMLKYLGFIWER